MNLIAAFWPEAAWTTRLRLRTAALWPAKMAANTLGMTVFFVAYFWVLHHPQAPVVVMPLTAPDRWVAFEPGAMLLYVSLWIYVSLPLALLRTRRELAICGAAEFAIAAIGLAIFLVWPTRVPASGIDWSLHPSVAFMKTLDAAGNACPSLHVAFAVFSAAWLTRLLGEMRSGLALQALNLAWCLGILYSTLATRQHVALDVLAGAFLGLAVGLLHDRRLRRADRPARGGRAGAPARVGAGPA